MTIKDSISLARICSEDCNNFAWKGFIVSYCSPVSLPDLPFWWVRGGGVFAVERIVNQGESEEVLYRACLRALRNRKLKGIIK
jgi:hypothetical protein